MSRTRVVSKRRGFTLLDLIVAVVLAVVGGGVLLASAPKVHEAAARHQSSNNLKVLALATINCADANQGKVPPGLGNFYPQTGPAAPTTPNNSYGPCLFHLLPYLEYANLYNASRTNVGRIPLFVSWACAGNPVKVYQGPGDPTVERPTDAASYLANALAVPQTSARFPASFTDGTSNTILFAEGYARAVGTLAEGGKTQTWPVKRRWWDSPVWFPHPSGVAYQLAPPADAADARLPQGFSKAGIQVAMADMAIRLVAPGCSAKTFYAACTPNGGEPLGTDW